MDFNSEYCESYHHVIPGYCICCYSPFRYHPIPFPFYPSTPPAPTSRIQKKTLEKKPTRKHLSDYKRLAVWNTYIGKEVYKHLCLVCNNIIDGKK